jgi:hypothetical protein
VTAQLRYRVWCLSWEEEEEHGADVIGYDILSHDYNKRVPRGEVHVPDTVLYSAAKAAEAYADYVHSQRDGYECSWPLQFRVRNADGSTEDFEVDREIVPKFSAAPIKPIPRKSVA